MFAGFLGVSFGSYTVYYYGKIVESEQESLHFVVSWIVGNLLSVCLTVVKSLFSAAFLARNLKKDICEKIFVDATLWTFVVSIHEKMSGSLRNPKLKELNQI